jgi:thiol-disulfide isomerase/thioredoxin
VAAGADGITRLVNDAIGAPAVPIVHVPSGGPQPQPVPPARPPVPPVGADAPALELRDLAGNSLELTDPDRDTLVLFWNPGCGFCQRMLDDVRAFEQAPPEGAPRLLLISTGTAEDNEAMSLSSPIALDQSFTAGTAFGTSGTPSGILVNRDGKIASGLAIGAPDVMALAHTPAAG